LDTPSYFHDNCLLQSDDDFTETTNHDAAFATGAVVVDRLSDSRLFTE
jgi:hypothetical protein